MLKIKLIKFILFVYNEYIYQDWSELTKLGRIFIKPAWFIRSIIFWIGSFILFPLVLLDMKFKNELDKMI